MPNLEYLSEMLTRSINELARAKDAILKEIERENAPRDVRLTRDEWAREMQLEATRPGDEVMDVRDLVPDADTRVQRRENVAETKTPATTPKKNS